MNQGVIFVDVDGTINKFRKSDNVIIYTIFKNHRVVRLLDKLLWKINQLDFFSNTMNFFKIRLFIYSLISVTSYRENMAEYEKLYIKYTFEDVARNVYFNITRLEKNGFKVHLITHSEFVRSFCERFNIKILKSKPLYIREFHKRKKISYVIGNNYFDDLRTPLKLKLNTIYIGESKLIRKIISKNAKYFFDIKEAVDYIIENSKVFRG